MDVNNHAYTHKKAKVLTDKMDCIIGKQYQLRDIVWYAGREVLPFRKILIGCRIGLTGTLWSSTKANAEMDTWDRIIPCSRTGWALGNGKQFYRKGPGDTDEQQVRMNQKCTLATKKVNFILGCITKGVDSKSREVISLLHSAFVKLHLEPCVRFWPS